MNFELSLLEECNWSDAMYYAGDSFVSPAFGSSDVLVKGIVPEDVEEILAQSEGEHDCSNWLLVFRTNDGRYCFLSAGCDYTGWDCQASGHTIVSDSLESLIQMGIGPTSDEFLRLNWKEGLN